MADHLMVSWSDCMLVQWSEGRMSKWSGGLMFPWICGLMDQWSGGLIADGLTTAQWSGGLTDGHIVCRSAWCHGNTALAASIKIISHIGSLQRTYSLSHNSYCIYVHAFTLFYFLSIGPLFRFFIVVHTFLFIYHYPFAVPSTFPYFYLPLFLSLYKRLPPLLYTVISPSTVPISGVPALFNYPASFNYNNTLVSTEGRIWQGKSGILISSPGKGQTFFRSPKRPASMQDPKLKTRGAIPPMS
jgi:hypothetical protein